MANPINTRISLRHDTYSAWVSTDPVLLKGEVAICTIPGTTTEVTNPDGKTTSKVTTSPTVLFKVGEDGNKTFSQLPWMSAKAADVYDWAKKSQSDFITWLDTEAAFATDAELAAVKSALEAKDTALEGRIATLEGKFSGDASVEGQIAGLDSRLDVIEGTGAGSVAKAEADAKAYADQKEADAKAYADGKASAAQTAAEAAAKSYTDAQISAVNKAISDEETARKNADKSITDQIGTGFSTSKTIASEIARVEGVASGASSAAATNATAIATEKTNRENADNALDAKISALETAYQKADSDLNNRIQPIETWKNTISNVMDFVGTSTTDPKGASGATVAGVSSFDKGDVVLYDAKEYVNLDGKNTTDSWEEFGVGTATDAAVAGLQARMNTAEADIDALQAEDSRLDQKFGNYVTTETFNAHVQSAENTYAKDADLGALTTRVGTAEGEIDQLQLDIVKKVALDDYNEKMEALDAKDAAHDRDILALQEASAKHALKTDLDAAIEDVEANTQAIEDIAGDLEALTGNVYTKDETDGKISTAVATEKSRAEAAEAALDARIDKYDAYFGTDAQGNLPATLIFNCGGASLN
jgi:hypothetical protein